MSLIPFAPFSLLPSQLYLLSRKSLSSIETQSLPSLLRCYPRSFTFYLGNPFPRFPSSLDRLNKKRTAWWNTSRRHSSRFLAGSVRVAHRATATTCRLQKQRAGWWNTSRGSQTLRFNFGFLPLSWTSLASPRLHPLASLLARSYPRH